MQVLGIFFRLSFLKVYGRWPNIHKRSKNRLCCLCINPYCSPLCMFGLSRVYAWTVSSLHSQSTVAIRRLGLQFFAIATRKYYYPEFVIRRKSPLLRLRIPHSFISRATRKFLFTRRLGVSIDATHSELRHQTEVN